MTSIFAEREEHRKEQEFFKTQSVQDLKKLEDEHKQLGKDLYENKKQFDVVEISIKTFKENLASLQFEVTPDVVESHAKKSLEIEKAIELLTNKGQELFRIMTEISDLMSQKQILITKLTDYLSAETRSIELENFIESEYLPLQQKFLDARAKLKIELQKSHHLISGEQGGKLQFLGRVDYLSPTQIERKYNLSRPLQ